MQALKIYGRIDCPYCKYAIDYCNDNGIEYDYANIDGKPELQNIIREYNQKTVPCVFRIKPDNTVELIGGYSNLVQWHEEQTMFD